MRPLVRNILLAATAIAVVGVGAYVGFGTGGNKHANTNTVVRNANVNARNSDRTLNTNAAAANADANGNSAVVNPQQTAKGTVFTEQKAAHFVRSEPANNASFSAVPDTVTIYFNFVLSDVSTISVSADGEPLAVGLPTLPADKLSMSVPVDGRNGAGAYSVTYRACWPDGSCDDGAFGFNVER